MAEAVWRYPPSSFSPHQSFPKNSFHPSGCMVNIYYITYYGLKDEMLIFQFPFMAESRQTLCAKRFSNLSQTIFHSQPIDFPFSSLRNEAWLKDA